MTRYAWMARLLLALTVLAALVPTGAVGQSQTGGQKGRPVPARTGAPVADGSLDPTFGAGGVVRTDFALGSGAAGTALAVQNDGKLLVAGATLNDLPLPEQPSRDVGDGAGFPDEFALARYNPDGTLDGTFGIGGKARASFQGRAAAARAIAIQPDGKIVLAGHAGWEIALARFNPDGTLDSSFGTGGRVTSRVADGDLTANAVLAQPGGKLVVAGVRRAGGCVGGPIHLRSAYHEDIVLARYNAGGSLDASFGVAGVVVTDFGRRDEYEESAEGATALIAAPDGALLLAGYSGRDGCTRGRVDFGFMLARYTARGDRDAAFGSGGVVTRTVSRGDHGAANAIALSGDKIVLAGSADQDFAAARYHQDGSADLSFDGDGLVITDFRGGRDEARGLAALPGGEIVAGGSAEDGGADFGLVRYEPDGSLDPTFGTGGKSLVDLGGIVDHAAGLAVATGDGRIVMAGGGDRHIAIAAFTAQGALDPGFGAAGATSNTFEGTDSSDRGAALALQADGRVVVAGSARRRDLDIAVARYNADGSPDPGFGDGGRVLADFGGEDEAAAVALQPGGRILVGGAIHASFGLVGFRANGSIDKGFGDRGRVTTRFATGVEVLQDIRLLPEGRILAVGTAGDGSLAMARFDAGGRLDATFGSGGKVTLPRSVFRGSRSLAVQADGKIVVAGRAGTGTQLDPENLAVARFNPDGGPDYGFGRRGVASLSAMPGYQSREEARAVAIQRDGKIVVAGVTEDFGLIVTHRLGHWGYHAIARFNHDGGPDASFGDGGTVLGGRLDFEQMMSMGAWDLLVQNDGRILLAGARFSLFRYEPDGLADQGFGREGEAEIAIGGHDTAAALLMQPDGRLLVAGRASARGTASDFALARVENRPSFADVAPADYFYEPVLSLAARGVIAGYGDGSFRPFNNTTRAQLAKIVVLAAGLSLANPATPTFDDVRRDHTFYQYVETAAAHGIAGGYDLPAAGRREFRPGADVTRGQLCKIVVLSAGWKLLDPAASTFADVPREQPFYRYIETAAARGVVSGYGREFRPGSPATRGQVAKIVFLAGAGEIVAPESAEPGAAPRAR